MATASTLSSRETIELFDRYVVPNYRRYPGGDRAGRRFARLGQ